MALVTAQQFLDFKEKKRKGAKGDIGLSGSIGIPGLQGQKGDRGPRGEQGEKGDTGHDGITGAQGDKGLVGAKGERGALGEEGLIGPMPRHQSRGDALRFEIDRGVWGKWINLSSQQPQHSSGGGSLGEKDIIAIVTNQLDIESLFNKLIDTVGDLKYIGESQPGTATSAPNWRIKRVDFSDAGGDIPILWANAQNTFVHVWDDRLTLTYSTTGL